MGWSYRKSFSSGPFRLNLSKNGISYSVGVKGARVSFGPRGTYVNLSSHGISYRRKISGVTVPASPGPQMIPAAFEEVYNIASADIAQLTDSDSKDFIDELTNKSSQISYVSWFGVFPLIVFLVIMLFTSFSSKVTIIQPASDSTFVRVTSDVGVNIRKASNAKAAILSSATPGQSFRLLDSADSKWLEVNFDNSPGYISRRHAAIEHVHHDQVIAETTSLSNPYAGVALAAGLVLFTALIFWLKKIDKKRFEIGLHYEMDEKFNQVYQQFGNHFTTFSRSARIWQYLNAQRTGDQKRNAGANQLIKRSAIRAISNDQVPLRYFVTNVAIPYLKLSNLEFFFLPERLLVKRGATFAAVFYKNLRITASVTRFIESEGLPADASVVGHTWRYLNKSGGPDRRFNDNRQLPVCAYSEYTLTSETGVFEVITTSKQGAMDAFAGFLAQIGELQNRMAIS